VGQIRLPQPTRRRPEHGRHGPSQLLDQIRATSGEVERIGRERIRGVQTTHYRAKVDLRRYPDLVPQDRRAAARNVMEQLVRASGTSTYPEDVWIDAAKRVRRAAITYTFKAGREPANSDVRIVHDLYDFGAPVHIELPPEHEVVDSSPPDRAAVEGSVPAP
jgi:hypothetical protein